ncbi:hypothetical protein ACEQ8H_004286 [Pleosporales sp. CAS-2024a]
MVGRFQPYMYDAPVKDLTFNPKAVTIASRLPQSPTKKQHGPLVDFNKHPDSYLIVPYGNTNAKPMKANTKTLVKIARWVQLFFRVLTLLGAMGVLLCSIFIRGASDTVGYIMRIPPGVDLVICLYAIYHLIRNAKSRPPGSSASYHFFALASDAGFIPFYIFTALLSNRNSAMEPGTVGRWRTMFPTDEDTGKVLSTTWLMAVVVASLHLMSLFLDMYLVVIFRKIAKLPPDMNPLEDNLTSRRQTKHKHKTSSMSALTPLTGDKEKRLSNMSTVAGDRFSQADPLISREIPGPDRNQVAFMNTRTNSDMTYSAQTPQSARQSRERFSMYSQPPSARHSRKELNHRDDLLRRDDDDDGNETLAERKSMLAQQANTKRHTRAESHVTNSTKENFYTPPATARSDKQNAQGDVYPQRNSRESLQNDNWFVHPDQADKHEAEKPYNVSPLAKPSMFESTSAAQGYTTVSRYDDVSDLEDEYELNQAMAPQPLRMNPPTPPPAQLVGQQKKNMSRPPVQQPKTTTWISTDAAFNRSHSPKRSGTPGLRYYGDLVSATSGIRKGDSASKSPSTWPTKGSLGNQTNDLPSATKQYISNTPPPSSHSPVKSTPFTLNKKSYTSVRRTGDTGYQAVQGQSPRVISRSGVDYMNAYEFEDLDVATGRRRDVSGKIAEEGLGGLGGMTFRKISGMA